MSSDKRKLSSLSILKYLTYICIDKIQYFDHYLLRTISKFSFSKMSF